MSWTGIVAAELQPLSRLVFAEANPAPGTAPALAYAACRPGLGWPMSIIARQ
jgi:hypothetical protein